VLHEVDIGAPVVAADEMVLDPFGIFPSLAEIERLARRLAHSSHQL
jgi:hypothetical protein